ncbi:shufflon protein A [Escherichia coli]|nr:shufflon protein A [Escherichia coli]
MGRLVYVRFVLVAQRDNKGIYTGGQVKGGTVRADGRLYTGEYLQLEKTATAGTSCSPNGLVGRDSTGAILSCQSGCGEFGSSIQTWPHESLLAQSDYLLFSLEEWGCLDCATIDAGYVRWSTMRAHILWRSCVLLRNNRSSLAQILCRYSIGNCRQLIVQDANYCLS